MKTMLRRLQRVECQCEPSGVVGDPPQAGHGTQLPMAIAMSSGRHHRKAGTHRSRLIMSRDNVTLGFRLLTDSRLPLRLTGIRELPGMVARYSVKH